MFMVAIRIVFKFTEGMMGKTVDHDNFAGCKVLRVA